MSEYLPAGPCENGAGILFTTPAAAPRFGGFDWLFAAATGLTISTSRCAIAGAVECPRRGQPALGKAPPRRPRLVDGYCPSSREDTGPSSATCRSAPVVVDHCI